MRTLLPLPEVTTPPARRAEKVTGLGAWIDEAAEKKKPPAKKRKSTPRDRKGYEAAREEAAMRVRANDWQDAQPKHLVGLYAVLHKQVYGVAPDELVEVWKGAVSAAKSMLDKQFGSDVEAFVEFIRWTWQRERRAEDRAKAEGNERRRLGWVLQFKSAAMITDYRVDMARAVEAAKPRGKR